MSLKELIKILRNSNTAEEIDSHRDEILQIIPRAKDMIGFDQQNQAHQYNLWEHCLWTVAGLPKDIDDDMVYLAALVHDIGKLKCQTYDERDGKVHMHYYGHQKISYEIVRDEIIPYILSIGENLTKNERDMLLFYVKYHDDHVSLKPKHLKRYLNMGITIQQFQNIMKLQVSDAKAHNPWPAILERIKICEELSGEYVYELYNDIAWDWYVNFHKQFK